MATQLRSGPGNLDGMAWTDAPPGTARRASRWPARLLAFAVLLADGYVTSSALPLTDAQQLFVGTAVAVATLWILLVHEDRQDRGPRQLPAASNGRASVEPVEGDLAPAGR